MQQTGSFKMRGTYNKLCSLTPDEIRKCMVACSAGNYAQGCLFLARCLGSREKSLCHHRTKIKNYGNRGVWAEVILHGDNCNETMEKVNEIIENEGRVFIHPFDDPKVIAGQGTIGFEILEDLWDIDNILVPIGGGGLIAGIAIALKSFNPKIRVFGVQAENVHGMYRSFKDGLRVSHRVNATVADGCDVALPGALPYAIVCSCVDDIILVSEEEMKKSMAILIQRNKIVTEGAGALTTAGLLSGKLDRYIKNKKTVNIISGGNIDLSKMLLIIDEVNKPNE